METGEEADHSLEDLINSVNTVGKGVVRPYVAVLKVNGKPLKMEVDTGAAVTLISQATWKSMFPSTVLQKSTLNLHTYTAEPISVLGQLNVKVKHMNYEGTQVLYVVRGRGPSLLGRNWLAEIQLDWAKIKWVHTREVKSAVQELLAKYADVFQTTPGVMTKQKARLSLKLGVQPVFRRAYSVPFALKDKVGRELDQLEECGINRRIEHAEWAAPIVPVVKSDGSLRICGNYKMSVNPHLNVDQYPLPKPADIMASVSGGKHSSKLDLRAAYQQMRWMQSRRN